MTVVILVVQEGTGICWVSLCLLFELVKVEISAHVFEIGVVVCFGFESQFVFVLDELESKFFLVHIVFVSQQPLSHDA